MSNYHLEVCCILEETNLTRKLKIHGPKIERSRKAPEELARRIRTRHWFVMVVFLAGMGKKSGCPPIIDVISGLAQWLSFSH